MKRALAIWTLTAAVAMGQSTITGSKTMQGSWDASGAAATKPAKSGATLPSTCGAGEFFFNTAAAAGQNVYLCNPTNTWTQVSAGVNSVFGRTGSVAAQSGDYSFSQLSGTASSGQLPAAGGDLSGTLTSATVKGIQGKTVSATAPTSGQVLTWNGTQWTPTAVSSAVGGDLSGTTVAATVQAIQGKAVSATAPSSGQVLTWNGSQWIPTAVSSAVGGDLSGTIAAATVQAIQGQSVAMTAPAMGQVLTWGGSSWGPQAPSGSGGSSTVTERVLVFDGSTSIAGETMTSWSCGSGSASTCSSTWTVPTNVYHVHVQIWSAGGSGQAEGAGNSGQGGGGGGFWEGQCSVTPGATVAITVGNGGLGLAISPWSSDGGNSLFGTCGTVVGGSGGANTSTAGWGGYTFGTGRWGWMDLAPAFTSLHDATKTFCTFGNTAGGVTTRSDGGGCGGGQATAIGNGFAGGGSINGGGGGGSGAYSAATGGTGGVSARGNTLYTNGGNGGNGGAWTSAGGYVACGNGVAPGGGGGSYGSATSGGTIFAGCNGARGEIRVYYLR